MTRTTRTIAAALCVLAAGCASPLIGSGAYKIGPGGAVSVRKNIPFDVVLHVGSGSVVARIWSDGELSEDTSIGSDERARFELLPDQVLQVRNDGGEPAQVFWNYLRPGAVID